MSKEPLEQQYFSKLLEHFPIGKCKEDFYYIMTDFIFEEDEKGHIKAVKAFKDKTWDQVDLSALEPNFEDFVPLTPAGMLYYLPAFLNNFYKLKLSDDFWFSDFVGDLNAGSFQSAMGKDEALAHLAGYEYFTENLTIEQSKLVALFLVNVANLSDSSTAQEAVSSYWGNFLLY